MLCVFILFSCCTTKLPFVDKLSHWLKASPMSAKMPADWMKYISACFSMLRYSKNNLKIFPGWIPEMNTHWLYIEIREHLQSYLYHWLHDSWSPSPIFNWLHQILLAFSHRYDPGVGSAECQIASLGSVFIEEDLTFKPHPWQVQKFKTKTSSCMSYSKLSV